LPFLVLEMFLGWIKLLLVMEHVWPPSMATSFEQLIMKEKSCVRINSDHFGYYDIMDAGIIDEDGYVSIMA